MSRGEEGPSGSSLIREVEVQAAACRDRVDQACSCGSRDPVVDGPRVDIWRRAAGRLPGLVVPRMSISQLGGPARGGVR